MLAILILSMAAVVVFVALAPGDVVKMALAGAWALMAACAVAAVIYAAGRALA